MVETVVVDDDKLVRAVRWGDELALLLLQVSTAL